MLRRAPAGLLLVASLTAAVMPAFAQDPQPAPPASATAAPSAVPAAASAAPAAASAAPAAAPDAQSKGVIVVAVGEGVTPAARALAMEVYRDPLLRPSIDEATARVLAGDAPAADATARLKEVADLRAAVGKAESPLIARRLLSSLGSEMGAPLVVAVSMDAGRPIAKALRSAGAAFERVELGATIETSAEGARSYKWPGAATTLRSILGVAEAEPLKPVAQKAPPPPAPAKTPFYKSPWFWGTAGVVAAAGITVLVLSRVQNGGNDVHLTGRIGP